MEQIFVISYQLTFTLLPINHIMSISYKQIEDRLNKAIDAYNASLNLNRSLITRQLHVSSERLRSRLNNIHLLFTPHQRYIYVFYISSISFDKDSTVDYASFNTKKIIRRILDIFYMTKKCRSTFVYLILYFSKLYIIIMMQKI